MADVELKPCPFCGGEPTLRIFKGKDGWRDRFAVLCRYDEGGCGAESGLFHYEAEAVEMWNRRADVQPVKREMVKIVDSDFMTQGYLTIEKFYSCPRCGETFGNVRFSRRSQLAEMYKFCYKCGQGLDWADATKG